MDSAAEPKSMPEADSQSEFVSQLCRSYGDELQRFLTGLLGNRALAEEIAQETYLKLYRLCRPGEVDCPKALLFDTATKLAYSHHRRLRAEKGVIAADTDAAEIAEIPDGLAQPDRFAASEQCLKWLEQIVDQLPPLLRQVFVMRYVEQMSRQEIAAKLQVTVKVVEKRLGRAVSHSRKRLSAVGLRWLGLD